MGDYPGTYRHSDLSYIDSPPTGQGSTLDPLRRSVTHNSHYSHGTASTRSWVQSNQLNPPPPPPDEYEGETNVSPDRTPRPLPKFPQSLPPGTLYAVNATEPADDEEEYMTIDPNVSGQYEFQQPHIVTVPTRRFFFRSPDPIPPPSSTETSKRSFVGGFVRGLRRLPKRTLGYGVGSQKARLLRRGTEGTDVSGTTAGMTTGNTLPAYRSNPSTPVAGPSGVQYVQDLHMAFAPNNPIPENGQAPPLRQEIQPETIPTSLLSGSALRRLTPSFRVTPPSDGSHESHAQIFQSPQPQYAQVVHPDPATALDISERTTVMVYSDTANGDPTTMPIPETLPPSTQWTPSRTPRVSGAPTRVSSVTIQTPVGAHHSSPAPLIVQQPPLPAAAAASVLGHGQGELVQSPATETLPPAPDYRKMPHFPGSPSRNTVYTRTTATSWYDPSCSSELTPVERFFHTLYHLPWVSHGRVTVDYRPGASHEGKHKYRGTTKKTMPSWYRRFSRAGKSTGIDLLSNGTMSIPDITPRASLGTSYLPSSPVSPRSNRTRRRSTTGSDGRQQQGGGASHRRHRRRDHRHRRRSMSTINEPNNERRAHSPIIPATYPYAYPPYPFTYPGYAAVPPSLPLPPGIGAGIPGEESPAGGSSTQQPMQMQLVQPIPLELPGRGQHQQSSKRSPRGPRSRSERRPTVTYPNGYVPYPGMPFPPPPPAVYVQAQGASNAQGQPVASGSSTMPSQQQPQIIQYVPMQLVPGAYHAATPEFLQHSMTTSIPSPPMSPTPKNSPPAA